MELPLLFQGSQFLSSVLLGIAFGILYDFLKGLRQNIRRLRHICDLIFVLCVFLSNLFFALVIGHGEYRIFMPVGSTLGAAIYFLVPHRLFLRIFSKFWQIVTYPARKIWQFFRKNLKKTGIFIKKLFSRRKKSVIIRRQSQNVTFDLEGKIGASVQIKTHYQADSVGADDLRHRHHQQSEAYYHSL